MDIVMFSKQIVNFLKHCKSAIELHGILLYTTQGK